MWLFLSPRKHEEQADADANSTVGDIERGKAYFSTAALIDEKVEEINDLMPDYPIDQIANNSAEK